MPLSTIFQLYCDGKYLLLKENSNMTSFFHFANKRAIYRLGIISFETHCQRSKMLAKRKHSQSVLPTQFLQPFHLSWNPLHQHSFLFWTVQPTNNKMNCELMLTYDTPALWQTGSRNLTGQKTLPTIWGTYNVYKACDQISDFSH